MEKIFSSVVIPTWNAASFVERVLEALVQQENVSFEILVVDNGVVNNETELVVAQFKSRFPNLFYLKFEKQLGYAGAVNAGVRAAKHSLIAVLNNDNIPDKYWLESLVKKSAAFPDAIISSLVDRAGMEDPLGAVLNLWCRVVRPKGFQRGETLFHPDGSAFLFNRDVFGIPYDEDYFIYQEDVALGWRAWLMGKQVLLARDSKAYSFDGGSTRRIAYKTAFFTERNRWLNYLIFLSLPSLLFLMPCFFLDVVVKFFFGSNRKAKFHAWAWIALHPHIVWKKRNEMQSIRVLPDPKILVHLSGEYMGEREAGARWLNPIFRIILPRVVK